MHPDRRLDDYAARQYGVFSLEQARSSGMTPKMIETRRANGAWVRMAPIGLFTAIGATQVGATDGSRSADEEGAIVAGRSAAYLRGLAGFRQGRPVISGGTSRRCSITSGSRLRGFEISAVADTIVTLARDHSRHTDMRSAG